MNTSRWISVLLICIWATHICSAVGVPHLNLGDLVKTSDVIAIGTITANIHVGHAEPIEFQGQHLAAQEFKTEFVISRFIKGNAEKHLTIRYSLPVSFNGYRALGAGTRMVFLKKENSDLVLADRYYPDFPAVPQVETAAASDDETRVINELLRVLASPNTSDDEKGQVLHIDYSLPRNPEVVTALRNCEKNSKDTQLKQRTLGELINFGDMDAVPHAAEILVKDQATEDQRIWLLAVIASHLTDAKAIPALGPMLASHESDIRASAVQALWHISGPDALPGLTHALGDSDRSVRFYAVRGLADIAQENGWGGPGETEFESHEQMYLKHWSDWARQNGFITLNN